MWSLEPLYQQAVPSLSFTIGLQTEPDVDAQEMALAFEAFRKLARMGGATRVIQRKLLMSITLLFFSKYRAETDCTQSIRTRSRLARPCVQAMHC